MKRIEEAYEIKEKMESSEALRWLERYVMLNALDNLYQEHLYAMDSLRQGVQLRSYGQRDPLVEYKQEAYNLYAGLMDAIKDEICSNIFRLSMVSPAQMEAARRQASQKSGRISEIHESVQAFGGLEKAASQGNSAPAVAVPLRREHPKVGRNEPCPCGSGKKYKACCGR